MRSRKAGGAWSGWRDGCEAVVSPALLGEGGGGRGRQPQSWSAKREGMGRTLTFISFMCLISRQSVTNRKEVGGSRLCFLCSLLPWKLSSKGSREIVLWWLEGVGDQGGCHFRVRIWRSGLEADVEEREAGMEGHWGPGARARRGPGRGHRAVSWNREQKAASAGTSQWTHSRGRDRDRFTPDPPCCRNERTDDRQCSQGGTCTCSSFSCSGTSPSPPGAARGN